MASRLLHKGLLIALMLAAWARLSAQDTRQQVQAVVDGVRSPQHAHEAALLIRQLPGVEMCRVDHNTRNLLLHLHAGGTVTEAQLEEVIAPLGMGLRCVRTGPVQGASFRHLDPRTCEDPPAAR
ncbi:MAG: hypothetical protein IT228_00920 [Flavobacteriales bacterium]|nr:hypothetical protein [Flavobacteriales bacterium]NUQ14158.1 hypothetical protein [Flavobacteriales bacterium]